MAEHRKRGRLDSLAALRAPNMRKALPRYGRMIMDDLPTKFQIARRIVFEPQKSMTSAAMWREHAKLMRKYSQAQAMIDEGTLDIRELDVPRFSLLDLKTKLAEDVMRDCVMCEHRCGVDRTAGKRGICGAGMEFRLTGSHVRTDYEQELTPSFSIFCAGCTVRFVECENQGNSDASAGTEWPEGKVARWAEEQHKAGCRTLAMTGGEPTLYVLNFLKVMGACRANIPVVFNSNAYLSEKAMELLDGIVDIYLLEFHYFNDDCARVLSSAPRYAEAAKRSHLLAKMQAELVARVPLLPDHLDCDAKPALKWIKDNLGPWTRVNILGGYEPSFRAREFMGMNRLLLPEERDEVVAYAKKIGLKNIV